MPTLQDIDATLALIGAFALALLLVGFVERVQHRRHVAALPLRINVNGSRGKSTVTRLLTGMLAEAGYETVGKTTGTKARLVFGQESAEQPVKRRPEGPNIREQKVVVRQVSKRGADALVSECMAVVPEYQDSFQRDLLRANVTVLTNVLEDHLREMGPTTDEVAEAFAATIPNDGILVMAKGPYTDYFSAVAEDRGTAVWVADPTQVPEGELAAFDYLVFPEHLAVALALAEALEIDESTALAGMKKANADPFATRVLSIGSDDCPAYFVSAFAANDPDSTLGVWRHLESLGHTADGLVVVMNCRADRWERSEQFAEEVLPALPARTVVAIGELTAPVVRAHQRGALEPADLVNLEGRPDDEVYATVRDLVTGDVAGQVVFGVGNVHHAAIPLIEAFAGKAAADGAQEPEFDVRH